MSMDAPPLPDAPAPPLAPAELIAALRAELAQAARERGHWNEEAGAGAAPDGYEQILAAAIRAIGDRYALD